MKYILSSIALFTLFITGCSDKLDPTPKSINLKPQLNEMNSSYSMKIKVKSGDTLKTIIERIQKAFPNRIIIDKVVDPIVFSQTLPEMTPNEFSKYIKINFGKIIVMRKYSEKIYSIEEIKNEDKITTIKNGSYRIPNMRFKINGKFTYEEAFNLLRERGINIYVDTQKPFDYSQDIGSYSGTLKEFLQYVSTKNKLFVIRGDRGIKLKDNETVTYNLKIPKVKLSPVLSPDGTNTAVTVTGAISGSVSDTKGGSGKLSPIDDLKTQFSEMFSGSSAKYSINMTQGTISVTGNYDDIRVSDKLVQDFNSIYGKGIKLELHVYEVSLSNNKAFGIDYSILKNELLNNKIVQTASFTTGLTNALTIGASNANGINGSFIQSNGSVTNGVDSAAAQTQSLIFKYLNKFGKTSVVTKPTLETINNLPVKLDVVDSIDYVYSLEQSSTNTAVANVDTPVVTSTVTQPEIKTVTTGFSLILHPKVQGDFINIAIKNISSTLNGLTQYTYGADNENVIRLKNVSAREFDETVKVKEGEIAIIGGYMYEKKDSMKNGLPYTTGEDTNYDALTSSKETNKHKVEIVITISAKSI